MADDRFSRELDWVEIQEVLTKGALWWARKVNAPSIFDGVSVDDVVSETLIAYFSSPNQLGWNPRKRPLETFLGRVCVNKLYDHYRRYQRMKQSADDPLVASQLTSNTNEQDLFERRYFAIKMLRFLKERIAQVRHQPEQLIQIVNALEVMGDAILTAGVNKCIADLTGQSGREVENGKKRLRRS